MVEGFKDLVGHSRQEVAAALVQRFGLGEAARKRMAEFEVRTPWQVFVQVRLLVYEALLADPELILGHRYPHNIALLYEVRRSGYPTALSTMSHCEQARHVLAAFGLADEFDVIATRDEVEHGKPDPEIDLLVACELGVEPEECLVIEDSPAGVQAGAGGRDGGYRRHDGAHLAKVPRQRPLGPLPGRGRPSHVAHRGTTPDQEAPAEAVERTVRDVGKRAYVTGRKDGTRDDWPRQDGRQHDPASAPRRAPGSCLRPKHRDDGGGGR